MTLLERLGGKRVKKGTEGSEFAEERLRILPEEVSEYGIRLVQGVADLSRRLKPLNTKVEEGDFCLDNLEDSMKFCADQAGFGSYGSAFYLSVREGFGRFSVEFPVDSTAITFTDLRSEDYRDEDSQTEGRLKKFLEIFPKWFYFKDRGVSEEILDISALGLINEIYEDVRRTEDQVMFTGEHICLPSPSAALEYVGSEEFSKVVRFFSSSKDRRLNDLKNNLARMLSYVSDTSAAREVFESTGASRSGNLGALTVADMTYHDLVRATLYVLEGMDPSFCILRNYGSRDIIADRSKVDGELSSGIRKMCLHEDKSFENN
jgi:hypothetical protein